jgi:hypothetical protein
MALLLNHTKKYIEYLHYTCVNDNIWKMLKAMKRRVNERNSLQRAPIAEKEYELFNEPSL